MIRLDIRSAARRAEILEIDAVDPRISAERTEVEGRTWRATFYGANGRRTIDSDHCPALGEAMRTFAALPPIALRSREMVVFPNPIPIPPTRMDGDDIAIHVRTTATDHSEFTVDLTGSQGPYVAWASATVRAIAPCWTDR